MSPPLISLKRVKILQNHHPNHPGRVGLHVNLSSSILSRTMLSWPSAMMKWGALKGDYIEVLGLELFFVLSKWQGGNLFKAPNYHSVLSVWETASKPHLLRIQQGSSTFGKTGVPGSILAPCLHLQPAKNKNETITPLLSVQIWGDSKAQVPTALPAYKDHGWDVCARRFSHNWVHYACIVLQDHLSHCILYN